MSPFYGRGLLVILTLISLIFATIASTTPVNVERVFGQPNAHLYVDPILTNKTHDDIDATFEVNVTITDVTDLYGLELNLTWENSLISLAQVEFTTTLNKIWGSGHWFRVYNESGVGYYSLVATSTANSFNSTSPTPLCRLTFSVQDPKTNSARNCSIHFDTHKLSNSQPNPIAHTVTDGNYTIAGREATVLITPSLIEKSYSDVGATFKVNVTVESVTDLFGFDLNVTWDSAFLNFSNCYYNATLDALWGPSKWFVAENESGLGYYKIVAVSTAASFNTTRSQAMFILEFLVENPPQLNETTIHFATHKLSDSQAEKITHLVENGTYRFGSTLTVTTVGNGSVGKSPNQIAYLNGAIVTLTASPSVGWSFANWSGDASGTANPTIVNMTSNKSVTATFTQNVYTLSVTIAGQGSVNPNNTGPYHYGDAVQLLAVPATGWAFNHWSGDLNGPANPGTLTINGNSSVTANFTQGGYTLKMLTVGQGTVLPGNGTYVPGAVVNIQAINAAGWTFRGWSGDASGSSNTTVVMNGNRTVIANFTQNTQNAYVLTISIDGNGSVVLNKTGPYNYGDVVQLTATPNVTWSFLSWSGNLTGSSNPATLTMTNNFTVTAHFTQQPMLQMNPESKTCHIYGENFTVAINLTTVVNVKDFTFEIHYNTTLLDYVNVTWNAWGTGTINVDENAGIITGVTSGTPLNGTQPLITVKFQAASQHVEHALTGTIFIQRANLSYTTGPILGYERGGLNQINVGPDFTYTFSPIQGDVNNNGTVDIFDLRLVAVYFNAKQGDPNWTEASGYDLNGDGKIDILDAGLVAGNFGYSYVP